MTDQQFQFALAQYEALRNEISERLTRVNRFVYLLLSGSLVYVTVIFVPLFSSSTDVLPTKTLWTVTLSLVEQNPLLMMLLCLVLFVPLICLATEAIVRAEEDGIRRIGIFIRENIEDRIIASKRDGWENWLDIQDSSFGKRSSEILARRSRFLIIALYCTVSALIGGFSYNYYFGEDFLLVTSGIQFFYIALGLGFNQLLRKSSLELTPEAIEVVILDLDGCLLNSAGQISDRNVEAIETLKRKGVKVILATGRASGGMWHYVEQLQLHGAHAVSNGACLAQWPDRHTEVLHAIDVNALNDLTRRLTKEGLQWAAFGETRLFCMTQNLNNLREQLLDRNDITIETDFQAIDDIETWDWSGKPKVSKIWCPVSTYSIKRNAWLAKTALELSAKLQGVRTTEETFEFFGAGVNKVSAVREILARLNLTEKTNLVLGDQNNDIKLLEWGDKKYAPSNASPEVRALLGKIRIDKSNDEDFVAEVVRELF